MTDLESIDLEYFDLLIEAAGMAAAGALPADFAAAAKRLRADAALGALVRQMPDEAMLWHKDHDIKERWAAYLIAYIDIDGLQYGAVGHGDTPEAALAAALAEAGGDDGTQAR